MRQVKMTGIYEHNEKRSSLVSTRWSFIKEVSDSEFIADLLSPI